MDKQPLMMGTAGNQLGLKSGGIGFTDRTAPQDDCSCPPCYCCDQPVYYTSYDRSQMTERQSWMWHGCCWQQWRTESVPILGSSVSYNGNISFLTMMFPCCEPAQIDVVDNGQSIGKVMMHFPICGLCDKNTIRNEIIDASGRSLYTRRDRLCCPTNFRFTADGCCGFIEIDHPIQGPREEIPSRERAALTFRWHTCMPFHPYWMGYKDFSPEISDHDRKLLLGMGNARLWRMERNRQNDNSQAGAGY